jgi:hypothetical protein
VPTRYGDDDDDGMVKKFQIERIIIMEGEENNHTARA